MDDAVWEAIGYGDGGMTRTERLPVAGGWLYKISVIGLGDAASTALALCFVPAPMERRPRRGADRGVVAAVQGK